MQSRGHNFDPDRFALVVVPSGDGACGSLGGDFPDVADSLDTEASYGQSEYTCDCFGIRCDLGHLAWTNSSPLGSHGFVGILHSFFVLSGMGKEVEAQGYRSYRPNPYLYECGAT
jgi:hypothetical protein